MDIFKPILKLMWLTTEKNDKLRLDSQIEPDGLVQIKDIPYQNDGEVNHLLDIYYPEGTTEKLPVIIDVHGGGWMYGNKELNKYYSLELAKRGFCVVGLNYRLALDKNVFYADQLSDLFSAYKWIGENIENYYGDLNNVFLTGDSAGGNLACVSSAINLNDDLIKEYSLEKNILNFKCVGAVSACIDLVSPNVAMNVNLKQLLGKRIKTSPCYKLLDFKNIANKNLPPFFIVTSSGDFVRSQSIKLNKLLSDLNVETEFYDWSDKINGKRLPHVFSVLDPFSAPAIKTIDDMTDFFKRHIS